MRLLLITSIEASWPYIPELARHLSAAGVAVDVADLFSQEIHQYRQDGRSPRIQKNQSLLSKVFLRLPLVRPAVKFINAVRFTNALRKDYDICHIHDLSPLYRFFVHRLHQTARVLVVSPWGSDFYRADASGRQKLRAILAEADAITFINPQTRIDVNNYYHDFTDKSYDLHFGLESIERIKRLVEGEPAEISRQHLGIDADAYVICCGYNGRLAQRHRIIIEALRDIRSSLPPSTIILIPMGYGASNAYREEIRSLLKDACLRYVLFDKMLDDEDNARIRRCTDLVINWQTTDQLSASVQEHLYADNTVIVGSWLPYQIFTTLGVRFHRAGNPAELRQVILDCVPSRGQHPTLSGSNAGPLYRFASWTYVVHDWIHFYSTVANNGTKSAQPAR